MIWNHVTTYGSWQWLIWFDFILLSNHIKSTSKYNQHNKNSPNQTNNQSLSSLSEGWVEEPVCLHYIGSASSTRRSRCMLWLQATMLCLSWGSMATFLPQARSHLAATTWRCAWCAPMQNLWGHRLASETLKLHCKAIHMSWKIWYAKLSDIVQVPKHHQPKMLLARVLLFQLGLERTLD